MFVGVINKPLKSGSSGQPSYQGVISYDEGTLFVVTDEGRLCSGVFKITGKEIKVSPLGMIDRRDFMQVGDKVNFQVSSYSLVQISFIFLSCVDDPT